MDILLDALVQYDTHLDRKRDGGSKVLVIITGEQVTLEELGRLIIHLSGKGPLQSFYRKKINEIHWNNISVHMAWLRMEDYPRLLGALQLADLSLVLTIGRFRGSRYLVAHVVLKDGSPHESGGYVWMCATCLFPGVFLVSYPMGHGRNLVAWTSWWSRIRRVACLKIVSSSFNSFVNCWIARILNSRRCRRVFKHASQQTVGKRTGIA